MCGERTGSAAHCEHLAPATEGSLPADDRAGPFPDGAPWRGGAELAAAAVPADNRSGGCTGSDLSLAPCLPSPSTSVDPARLRYPEHLPVVERRDDILAALRDHQVVVVAGETGSGKTTQLPKMCLELGRGGRARSATPSPGGSPPARSRSGSPRRCRSSSATLVGYQVRFTDHSSDATRLKVMTDGILLAEMQRDRDLRRYDTIIIDEAHERSLNIDFILGYLKQLLPRRPDLKVVVTSATIDPVAVREPLRHRRARQRRARGAGHRGLRAHLPRRDALPPPRRAAPRRPPRRRRARPGDRGRRGRRGAVDRGAPERRGHRHPRRSSPGSARSATPPTP